MAGGFRATTRGRYRQVVNAADGRAPEAALFRCTVDEAPYERGGKTYLPLDVGDAAGDMDVLRAVDAFIASQARPAYSPVASAPLLVVKVLATTRYDDEVGNPAAVPWTPRRGQEVDVLLRPGAFGDFGYCLLLRRIKPHATVGEKMWTHGTTRCGR